MRIVSKFNDYYDSVMGHGQDLGTVYVRTPKEITDIDLLKDLSETRDWRVHGRGRGRLEIKLPRPKVPHEVRLNGDSKYSSLRFGTEIVLFCGKVYRGIRIEAIHQRPIVVEGGWHSSETEYFYSYADLEEFLHSCGKLVKDIYRSNFSGSDLSSVRELESFLSKQGTSEVEESLIKHRIVTARYVWTNFERREWIWQQDESLKSVKFFKVKDPYTAFQELDMYISGVLGQQGKETINISDKDRIYQHGFDGYSFRKPPGEKGRKKQ